MIPTDFGDFWENFALSWAVSRFRLPWVAGCQVRAGRSVLDVLGPSPGTWVKEISGRHFEGRKDTIKQIIKKIMETHFKIRIWDLLALQTCPQKLPMS